MAIFRVPLLAPVLAGAAALLLPIPVAAQDAGVPYWSSIRVSEVNMRVGPGEDYRITWVYHRPGLPMKVLRVKEGWRYVRDPDGAEGWVMARFLTRERTGFVTTGATAPLRDKGESGARLLWKVAPGVVGKLGDCAAGWCEFAIGPRKGFVEQARLWGAGEP
jgi:SH3-like domain-containing protein